MSDDFGCIEYISECKPLSEVLSYKSKFHANNLNNEYMNRLVASAAGAYISSYILGVRDRHHDNILVRSDGCLFHIDFGYALGEKLSGFDAAKFALTSDLQSLMGEKHWKEFVRLSGKAFQIIRENWKIMFEYGKIALKINNLNWNDCKIFLKNRLIMDVENAEQVVSYIEEKIDKAPSKLQTKIKNAIHSIAVKM